MYILAILIFSIILVMFYINNEVTNKKIIEELKNKPNDYNINDAINNDNLVDYYGIIKNLNLLYNFVDDCNNDKTTQITFTSCNNLNELIIKTALYKNGKIYVNIDNTRTTSLDKGIKTFKYDDFELLDNDDKLQLTFKNKDEEINFFSYDKKVGKRQ